MPFTGGTGVYTDTLGTLIILPFVTTVVCTAAVWRARRAGRLARRARVVAEETGRDLDAVLAWTEAWCALSAAWDAASPAQATRVEALGLIGAAARSARRGHGRAADGTVAGVPPSA